MLLPRGGWHEDLWLSDIYDSSLPQSHTRVHQVERSKYLNESRIKVLQAREDAMQQVLSEAHGRLARLAQDKAAYKPLLVDLLVQSFAKLRESKMLVRVREADEALVKDVLATAADAYAKRYDVAKPEVRIDTKHYLAPPPNGKRGDEADACSGGVVVTTADGAIVCGNTLDERLDIVYSQLLPSVRTVLFGEAN